MLTHGAPCDEFDSYSRYLAEIITANDTVDEIAAIIVQTMDKEFDEKVNPAKFLDTAQKIWNMFSERKDVNS